MTRTADRADALTPGDTVRLPADCDHPHAGDLVVVDAVGPAEEGSGVVLDVVELESDERLPPVRFDNADVLTVHVSDATRTTETPPDRHLVVQPCCPVCGSQDFSGFMDDPDSVRWHYVSGTCGECHALLEIEYAAVDVRVADTTGEGYSGVQSGTVPHSFAQYGLDPLPEDFSPEDRDD